MGDLPLPDRTRIDISVHAAARCDGADRTRGCLTYKDNTDDQRLFASFEAKMLTESPREDMRQSSRQLTSVLSWLL